MVGDTRKHKVVYIALGGTEIMIAASLAVPEEKPERLLPLQSVANRLGLSIWTVRTWCYAGRIASCKLGSRLMVPESEVDRLIRETMRPAVR